MLNNNFESILDSLENKKLQTFGRVKSKKLSPNQERLFNDFLPTVSVASYEEVKDTPCEELIVEIGFGCGEHLIHQALSNPEKLYIGCEPFINGSVKTLAQIEKEDIGNIRIFNGDAREILETFPSESVDKFFILQPDPWPKLRHYKRRLIQPEFLDLISSKLKLGKLVRMSTDDYSYAKWIVLHFMNHPKFSWIAKTPSDWQTQPSDHIQTKYQKKALKAGRKAVFMHFEKN